MKRTARILSIKMVSWFEDSSLFVHLLWVQPLIFTIEPSSHMASNYYLQDPKMLTDSIRINSEHPANGPDTPESMQGDKKMSFPSNQVPVSKKYMNQPKMLRYQSYDGKSKVWCKGRILTGPKPLAIPMTFCLTNIQLIFYYAFIIPKLENRSEFWAYLCTSLFLNLAFIYFMFKTAFMNPGIIPK